MAVVAVVAARTSCGATTLAAGLARSWPNGDALLVEADPDGGVLAARLGLTLAPNLSDLAGLTRSGLDAAALDRCCKRQGDLAVIVAHPSAEQTSGVLRAAGERLAVQLAAVERRSLVLDAGRLRPGSPAQALTEAADAVLVVVRPSLDDLTALAHRLALVPPARLAGIVLSGAGYYAGRDVAQTLGLPVLAVLPEPAGRRSAAVYRSAVAELARRLDAHLVTQPPSDAAAAVVG